MSDLIPGHINGRVNETMGEVSDIGVLGSGPAALAVAAACSRAGASVTVVAPDPDRPWAPNYCLWEDEVPATMRGGVACAWATILAATTVGERRLARSYVKLDNEALRQRWWTDVLAASGRVVAQSARRLDHRDSLTRIHTEDGTVIPVRVAIDASGAQTSFVERVHQRPPAHQIAYGLLLDAPGHGFDPDCAVLMDFRPAGAEATEPPSFLYALPMPSGRLFVEETSLAQRPGVSMDLLRERLEMRLSRLGLERACRVGEERCAIAMGLGLPAHGQSLVPFGAAASMVHPASGYSIARVLRKAEPVARAIVEGLDEQGPELAVAAGNAALWPRTERALWELYALGLETVVGMNTAETTGFFDAFFGLPQDDWADFLSGTLSPRALVATMTRLFRNLPASVRWHLVRTSVSAGAAPLARTFLPPGSP